MRSNMRQIISSKDAVATMSKSGTFKYLLMITTSDNLSFLFGYAMDVKSYSFILYSAA
jgi:hypothetical protein